MNIIAAMKVPAYREYGGIYRIVAEGQPGASYVGQTKRSFSKRWSDHLTMLQSGIHHNDIMQGAFGRVGVKGLHACHLIVAPPLHGNDLVRWLFEWEAYYIALYGAANEARRKA